MRGSKNKGPPERQDLSEMIQRILDQLTSLEVDIAETRDQLQAYQQKVRRALVGEGGPLNGAYEKAMTP